MSRPSKKRIPTLEEIKIEKPMMSDKSAAEYRAKLVSLGVITPDPSYPTDRDGPDGYCMSPQRVARLRERLIEEGSLRPGAGMARLRASKKTRNFVRGPRTEQ